MINRDGKIRVYSPKRIWTDPIYDKELEELCRRKKNDKD
jgi:hypothetical protein